MKNTLIIYISLLFSFALNGQELSRETLQASLVGYWKGNKFTNDKEILVINGDNTYQYFKNKVKIDYGNLEIDYQTMFRLYFNSDFGIFTEMDIAQGYIWILPNDKLQFGASPIDGGDSYYDRMNSKEIDDFLGKKLLSKAIKKKSEKLLIQYFSEWQLMESGSGKREIPSKELSTYQKETNHFFSDFYSERLKSVKESRYSIIEISINRTGYADFALPTEFELDSFANSFKSSPDYRVEMSNLQEKIWGRYFQKKLENQKIAYDRLENFIPDFSANKNVTCLILRLDRAKVIHACLSKNDKKYRNWLFFEKYLSPGIEGQHDYDFTDTPMIQNLVFNTQLNLAIVDYVYTYAWVKDLYERKDGKWQFHSTIMNRNP
jgi:hypothetical protein